MDFATYSKFSFRKKQFFNDQKILLDMDLYQRLYLKNYFKYLITCKYNVINALNFASKSSDLSVTLLLVANGANIYAGDDVLRQVSKKSQNSQVYQ